MELRRHEKKYLKSKKVWRITIFPSFSNKNRAPKTAVRYLKDGEFLEYVDELRNRNVPQVSPFNF